jgi:hypothetical protein
LVDSQRGAYKVHAHTSTRRCKRGTRRSNSTESKSD